MGCRSAEITGHSTITNAFDSQRIDVFLRAATTGDHPLMSDGEETQPPVGLESQNRGSRAFARLSGGWGDFFLDDSHVLI